MPDATATRDAPSRAAREATPPAALETSRAAPAETSRPALGDTPRARIRGLLGRRAIAYHPAFAAVGGGVTAGVFLAQLFYWHDRGRDPDGWIYKTQAEWEEETGLTRCQQETARRKLRARGLLEEKLAGIPARLHYRLDVERLIQLLSPQVHLTAGWRPSGGSGEGPGPTGDRRRHVDSSPLPADRPRSRSREPHNQVCGIPTNKYVGTPQTSSRGFRRHAETTIEDSREEGAERLAAGPPNGSWAGPSRGAEHRPARQIEAGWPSEVMCSLHGVPMRLREKDGDRWYSHRLDDGAWCKGARGDYARGDCALGDHAQGQGRGRDDPQSIEFRQEYLAWADPDTRLEFRREDYVAYAAYAEAHAAYTEAQAAYAEADDGAEPQADTAARRAALAGGGDDAAGGEAHDADPPPAQGASSCPAQRASSCPAQGASPCAEQPADPPVGAPPKPPPGPPVPGPPPAAPRAPPADDGRWTTDDGVRYRLQDVTRQLSGQVRPDVSPVPARVTARGPPGRTTHRGGRAARLEPLGASCRVWKPDLHRWAEGADHGANPGEGCRSISQTEALALETRGLSRRCLLSLRKVRLEKR